MAWRKHGRHCNKGRGRREEGVLPGPEREQVLSAAARLQQLLPDAVLVGGTADDVKIKLEPSRQESAAGNYSVRKPTKLE